MAHAHATKDSASLADFMQVLRVRRALMTLILALVVVTTAVVTAFLPKWYLATTKVRVEKPEGEVKLFQAQSSNNYDPYFLQDQFKIEGKFQFADHHDRPDGGDRCVRVAPRSEPATHTRGGDPRDPLQEVMASDTVHSQTGYLASYLQLRLPAFASADVTFTAGYGFATLGQMLMGEIGMHYDVSSEVGVNVGLRAQRFSYDLTAEKDAALHSGNGSLVVPSGVAAASPSLNTELTTGLFFHF